MKVTVVVFSLNEIEGMKAMMPRILPEWYDQLLVVDGGSTDGTLEYARKCGAEVLEQKTKGISASFHECMPYIKGDISVFFSPDGNSVPERIPEMVAKVKEGCEIVICSRYLDDAKSEDDNALTAFGNWLFTTMTNLCFGCRITDSLVIYRAFRTKLVEEMGVGLLYHSWASQLLFRAVKAGRKIGEVSGDEPARIGGESKLVPLRDGYFELIMILSEFLRPRAKR